MLACWLYRSKALADPRSLVDDRIGAQSRENNPDLGITGYLHRDTSVYVQYIEGPAKSVNALSHRIRSDARHYDIGDLMWELIPSRRFSLFDMAFTDEKMVSFETFRKSHNNSRDLAAATGSELLAFMEENRRTGFGSSVLRILLDLTGDPVVKPHPAPG